MWKCVCSTIVYTTQNAEILEKVLFKIDFTDLCLLPFFFILFKSQLKGVILVLASEVDLVSYKIKEPIDA